MMANETVSTPSATPSVRWWLRAEGLAVAAATGYWYSRGHFSWWLFAALWLVPDLSMIAYLAGPRIGARGYNALHSYVAPAVLAGVGVALNREAPLPFVLIWCNHIGVDRFLGYGLKYPDAFGYTHLGRLGKPRPAGSSPTVPAPPA